MRSLSNFTDPNGRIELPGDFEREMENAERRIDFEIETRRKAPNSTESAIRSRAIGCASTAVKYGRTPSFSTSQALKRFREENDDPESPLYKRAESFLEMFCEQFVQTWNEETNGRQIDLSDTVPWDYVEEKITFPTPPSWRRPCKA